MTTFTMLSVPRGYPRWSRFPTARSGFSLIEMLVVLVLISAMAGIIAPRMRGYRERLNLDAARTQVESAVATARSAAIQKGFPAKLRIVNNQMTVVATVNSAGLTMVILGPVMFDSSLGVRVQPAAVADSLITFEARGFASPRLAATGKFRITGTTRSDSVCVTVTGALLPRGCAL